MKKKMVLVAGLALICLTLFGYVQSANAHSWGFSVWPFGFGVNVGPGYYGYPYPAYPYYGYGYYPYGYRYPYYGYYGYPRYYGHAPYWHGWHGHHHH